eukprot:10719000-Karenia_brevis.AAC.1
MKHYARILTKHDAGVLDDRHENLGPARNSPCARILVKHGNTIRVGNLEVPIAVAHLNGSK